ncbi:glycosyl transferase [Mycolicibacterium murale]|uniref:Glycosyl transferase n=1 Tax=Mycolicibacterium murale TaxID=182220 RepID=A0A7I9WSP4_9MYCO|nr:glycosyl transferase [Mycolicibacterium murale]
MLLWHVHGSWTHSFVQGPHRYLLPVNGDRDADGRGLCGRDWPAAHEVDVEALRRCDIDCVVLQRPEELTLVADLLGRHPGADIPAVYVEHNAPRPHPVDSRHPLADRTDIPLVHVTDFNQLMWDSGMAPDTVITHGIADPGQLYSGEVRAAATMINEPIRRARTVGTDLLPGLAAHLPIDVWGIGSQALNDPAHRVTAVTGRGDLSHRTLLPEIARRVVYLHTARWTSLGLSLVEAMYLGMPVVAVAGTMAPLVVPAEAGVVSADIPTLARALTDFADDPSAAHRAGKAAREYAIAHFSLDRFLQQWDDVIDVVCAGKEYATC